MIKVGSIVSRNKYNNDILFKVKLIDNQIVFLEGINERLCADSNLNDLFEECGERNENDEEILNGLNLNLDRDNYFYIPGKILHIDADYSLRNPFYIKKYTV